MIQNSLQHKVIGVLKTIYDPEIPVNIWDLGLIYGASVNETGICIVVMTFTSPNCPVIDILPEEIKQKINGIEGISQTMIEIVWDPKWDMSIVSDEIKLELGVL